MDFIHGKLKHSHTQVQTQTHSQTHNTHMCTQLDIYLSLGRISQKHRNNYEIALFQEGSKHFIKAPDSQYKKHLTYWTGKRVPCLKLTATLE